MKYYFNFLFFLLLTTFCAITSFATTLTDIDNILVLKSERLMMLKSGDKIIKKYKIALGGNPIGPKEREGDKKTPEGKYKIEYHNPHSSYHLSLKISYPTKEQTEKANANGYKAGNFIMIHGYPNNVINKLFDFIHNRTDWTDGCIAVTDEEIEEIYELVKDGTPIEIMP